MRWDEETITQTLREMKAREQVPLSERRLSIRSRLLGSFGFRLSILETRLGWIGLACSDRGVISLRLPKATRALALEDLKQAFPTGTMAPTPEAIELALREYAEGQCGPFDVPLDLSSLRPFQRAVLTAISHIPIGETRTYGWVARVIGKPGAARAVGQALHTNPIPIILPCHRVVASDGKLGGYGGGLAMKIKLLRLEGVAV